MNLHRGRIPFILLCDIYDTNSFMDFDVIQPKYQKAVR